MTIMLKDTWKMKKKNIKKIVIRKVSPLIKRNCWKEIRLEILLIEAMLNKSLKGLLL